MAIEYSSIVSKVRKLGVEILGLRKLTSACPQSSNTMMGLLEIAAATASKHRDTVSIAGVRCT